MRETSKFETVVSEKIAERIACAMVKKWGMELSKDLITDHMTKRGEKPVSIDDYSQMLLVWMVEHENEWTIEESEEKRTGTRYEKKVTNVSYTWKDGTEHVEEVTTVERVKYDFSGIRHSLVFESVESCKSFFAVVSRELMRTRRYDGKTSYFTIWESDGEAWTETELKSNTECLVGLTTLEKIFGTGADVADAERYNAELPKFLKWLELNRTQYERENGLKALSEERAEFLHVVLTHEKPRAVLIENGWTAWQYRKVKEWFMDKWARFIEYEREEENGTHYHIGAKNGKTQSAPSYSVPTPCGQMLTGYTVPTATRKERTLADIINDRFRIGQMSPVSKYFAEMEAEQKKAVEEYMETYREKMKRVHALTLDEQLRIAKTEMQNRRLNAKMLAMSAEE